MDPFKLKHANTRTHTQIKNKKKAKQGSIIEYSKTNNFKFLIIQHIIDSKLNIQKNLTDNGKVVI